MAFIRKVYDPDEGELGEFDAECLEIERKQSTGYKRHRHLGKGMMKTDNVKLAENIALRDFRRER